MHAQDVTSEAPKIAAAVRAEFLHRIRAKHPVAFELRFREKLVSVLVGEGFAPLKVCVNVARFVAPRFASGHSQDGIPSVFIVPPPPME